MFLFLAICLYIFKSIKKHSKEELYCQLPSDTEIDDFGPVPRSRYPLVALLTLADEEDREIYDIVSNWSIRNALPLQDLGWFLIISEIGKRSFLKTYLVLDIHVLKN